MKGDHCICGAHAWFLSHLTIWERFGFWSGLMKDGDLSAIRLGDAPLGGHHEMIKKHWGGAPQEENHNAHRNA